MMAAAQKPSVSVEIPPSLEAGSANTSTTTIACTVAVRNVWRRLKESVSHGLVTIGTVVSDDSPSDTHSSPSIFDGVVRIVVTVQMNDHCSIYNGCCC